MSSDPYTLAIETSARIGSVSLGCGPDILETADLPQQRRHAIDLIPAIDRLCETAGATSDQIDRIYISLGPGSFTGLRVGITTAKTIAYATGCELYGIDSLQVVAANAPADGPDHLAVCLNAKKDTSYTGLYERQGGQWISQGPPTLMSWAELLQNIPRPFALIADQSPTDLADDVIYFDSELATPRSEQLWKLGSAIADQQDPIDPFDLVPLYVRVPEAEEVWQARQEQA